MKPLLVGEANPYGADPRHALFPWPKQSAGYRLALLILAMPSKAAYLQAFDRVNLCPQKWSAKVARDSALKIMRERRSGEVVVLLGSKVAAAFGMEFKPFTASVALDPDTPYVSILRATVILPHPSGLCRLWNEPGAIERARRAMREAGVIPDSWRPKP